MRIANVVATAAVMMGIGKMGVTAPAKFEKTGQVVGQLVDVNDHITYAGEAVVFLCDARTSYPIHRKTKRPVKINVMDRLSEIWETWYAVTDENGVFQFNEVPVGCYRLVAQSWSGTKGIHSRIGADGILNVTLPIGKADADREVQVTVDPIGPLPMTQEEWRNFILATAGSVTDPTFARHEQGEYECREELP